MKNMHHFHLFMSADPFGWGSKVMTRVNCLDSECSGLNKKMYPVDVIGPKLRVVEEEDATPTE